MNPPPVEYRLIHEASDGLLDDLFTKAGYEKCGPEWESELNWTMWKHRADRHLHVALWDSSNQLTAFFVAANDVPDFFVEKYPAMVAAVRNVDQIHFMEQIARIFLAFVRHGHGRDTICSLGWNTLDDIERQRVAERKPGRAR